MKVSTITIMILALAVLALLTARALEPSAEYSLANIPPLPNWDRVRISVAYDVSERPNNALVAYSGTGTFTIENIDSRPIKIRLPLLRSGVLTQSSFSEILYSELQTEWKNEAEANLLPGESMTVTTPIGYTATSQSVMLPNWRHTLVFGAPSGETADGYLSGTIVSQPVKWNILP